MTMTTITTQMTTTTTPSRGFGQLPCPLCGAWNTLSIELSELTKGDACKCLECDEQFGLGDVRARLAAWQRVLAWVDAAPTIDE
jgi:hypothetical protein